VVIAARLCAAAEAGQVLVSDVTRALVAPRRVHRFSPLGGRALKGVAGAGGAKGGGGLVLPGRGDEERAGPYQPLAEALGPYVAAVPRAELRQQLGPAGGGLTRVLPRLAGRGP